MDPSYSDCPESLLWRKEKEDPRVDNILRLLKSRHEWDEKVWVGGDDEPKKQDRPSKPGEKGNPLSLNYNLYQNQNSLRVVRHE